jgi:transcriptional regulator with XRE-family HTH domain
MADVRTAFASHLREYRLDRAMSQAALAHEAGLSVDAIGMLERGARRSPRRDTVAILARALKLSSHEREQLLAAASDKQATSTSVGREAVEIPPSPPPHLTACTGREREIAEIQELLQAKRLVTLTGAGGIGKTRLPQELALALHARFAGAVTIVELAVPTDGELVPSAIGAVLGVHE